MDFPVGQRFLITLRYPEHDDPRRREPHDIEVFAPNPEVAAKKAAVFGRRGWRGGLRWDAEIISVRRLDDV